MMPFFKLAVLSLCVTEIDAEQDLDDDLLSHTIMKDICTNLPKHDFIEPETGTHEMH